MVELRCQRLVVRDHDGGPVHRLDYLGHGVGLARPGDAEKHLILLAVEDAPEQRLNGRALIALRLVIAD